MMHMQSFSSFTLGMASNAWLASKDRSIELLLAETGEENKKCRLELENKCAKLADLAYKAVDAQKTGIEVRSSQSH